MTLRIFLFLFLAAFAAAGCAPDGASGKSDETGAAELYRRALAATFA